MPERADPPEAHDAGRDPFPGRSPAGRATEVVVVEDHPPVRQGLELLLPRHGFRVTGSAGSAAEGARMIRARAPDVALVDIALGDDSGTDVARDLHDEGSATAIVLYTGSIDSVLIDGAVASGARGLVLKSSPIEHLADAIRAAAAGRDYVDRLVAQIPGRSGDPGARRISKREAQILGMLSQGGSTERIAQELFLSPETVQTHVRNATRKLGAHGRLHAVILALVHGEIDLPDLAR
jgi:DNA-binding NarL/FixJ family response regulator